MRTLKILPALFFVFISMSSLGYCMQQEGDESFLYNGMNYKTIFDQRGVLARHPDALLQEGLKRVAPPKVLKEGCLTWVFHKLTCGCFRNDDTFDEYSIVENASLIGDSKDQDNDFIVIDVPFDSETSKKLNNALLQDFKTKKADAMKRTLRRPIFSLCVDGAIYGGGLNVLPSDGSGFTAFVFLNVISENVKLFSKAVYSIYLSPLGDPLELHEQRYAKCKRFLSPALQETIEDKFGAARKSNQSIPETQNFCRIALNLPLTSKELMMPDHEDLEKLLGGYEPEDPTRNITERIQMQLYNHFKRFSHKMTPSKFPKSVIYLQGPPGVGKTYIAEELARLMGADFIKLTVSKGAEKFLGNTQEPGDFLQAIARHNGSRNAVVFLDEFDRFISDPAALAVFLPFLEPDSTDFDSPYLKSSVGISDFLFVAAGNDLIADKAMTSRPEVISIKQMKPSFKKEIIEEKFFPHNQKHPCNKNQIDIDGMIKKSEDPGIRELIKEVTYAIRKVQFEEERKIGRFLRSVPARPLRQRNILPPSQGEHQ